MALPHDRSSLLWNDGPTDRFTKSMERWINAMYSDDPSNIDVITAGRSISRIIAKETASYQEGQYSITSLKTTAMEQQ